MSKQAVFQTINDVPGSTDEDWDTGLQLQKAMGIGPEMSGTRREFVRQARQLRKDGWRLVSRRVEMPTCPRCGRCGIWHPAEKYCDLCGSVEVVKDE